MDVESSAATLFSRLMLTLGEAVGADEAERDGLDASPLGPEELLRLLVGGLDESWWDDVGTVGEETRAEILRRVIEDLDGLDQAQPWGDVHQVFFDHPLAWIPGVGRMASDSWSRGPFRAAGDNVTINAHYWSRTRPFEVTTIPAMRFVTEVGNWDETVLVLPVGQSGRPWSAHYADQIASWLEGGTQRFPYSRDAVEKSAVAWMELLPTKGDGDVTVGAR